MLLQAIIRLSSCVELTEALYTGGAPSAAALVLGNRYQSDRMELALALLNQETVEKLELSCHASVDFMLRTLLRKPGWTDFAGCIAALTELRTVPVPLLGLPSVDRSNGVQNMARPLRLGSASAKTQPSPAEARRGDVYSVSMAVLGATVFTSTGADISAYDNSNGDTLASRTISVADAAAHDPWLAEQLGSGRPSTASGAWSVVRHQLATLNGALFSLVSVALVPPSAQIGQEAATMDRSETGRTTPGGPGADWNLPSGHAPGPVIGATVAKIHYVLLQLDPVSLHAVPPPLSPVLRAYLGALQDQPLRMTSDGVRHLLFIRAAVEPQVIADQAVGVHAAVLAEVRTLQSEPTVGGDELLPVCVDTFDVATHVRGCSLPARYLSSLVLGSGTAKVEALCKMQHALEQHASESVAVPADADAVTVSYTSLMQSTRLTSIGSMVGHPAFSAVRTVARNTCAAAIGVTYVEMSRCFEIQQHGVIAAWVRMLSLRRSLSILHNRDHIHAYLFWMRVCVYDLLLHSVRIWHQPPSSRS